MGRSERSTSPRDVGGGIYGGSRGREVAGILLLGLALFVGLSVASLQIGSNTLMGPCGARVGLGIYALFGVGAYLTALGLGVAAVRCLQGQMVGLRSVEAAGAVGAGLSAAVLLHLAVGHLRLHGYSAGGLVGEYGAEMLCSLVGQLGAVLFGVVGLAACLVLSTPLSVRGVSRWVGAALRGFFAGAIESVMAIFPERSAPAADARPIEQLRIAKRGKRSDDTFSEIILDSPESATIPRPAVKRGPSKRDRAGDLQLVRAVNDGAQLVGVGDAAGSIATEGPISVALERTELSIAPSIGVGSPKIVEPLAVPKKDLATAPAPKPDFIPAKGGYHLPDLSLLDYEDSGQGELDRNSMLKTAERLVETLEHYSVRGRVVQIHPGPVVTMYEFVPEPGTKLSKITTLDKDLAMSLEAMSVRIVAPIPGKGSVGFEVPNKARATVYLKEILVEESVQKAKSKLTIGLGKDISGTPVAVDLAKMPHLLVAGTTGSGKSVGVNGMICSILFNATPEEVRLLMIDPKMLELSIYEGIPHLLLPVVTDPKKANLALRWAVDEMERRYELISKSGVRDILGYNKKVEKILADGPPVREQKKIKIYVADEQGGKREIEVAPDEESVEAAGGAVTQEVRDDISAAHAVMQKRAAEQAAELPPRKLPSIVVIIDEFADLMMVASKEVETSVARIAQKARAAGIHLIIATQRPSVDVITGLIKANFPSRIAFQVASKIDSRTILDQQGAENLLGMGDMLFTDRGQSLRRVHGALVTDVEIKRLVDFLKLQGQPVYDLDILKPRVDEEGDLAFGDEAQDEMYDLAVRLVCESRQASVSMIQRRLQIGYNRAARMVERMEREGIVGAANGAKPREVLAQAV